MFPDKEPIEVKILKGYIRDWKELANGFLLIPRTHLHFNKLFLQSRHVFMERIFDFSAIIELISKDQMNEKYKQLHRSLTELSCELSWSGFLSRKPRFKRCFILEKLKKEIPTLHANDKLINILNNSVSVINLLKKVRPDCLYVTLSSYTLSSSHLGRPENNLYKALAKYYYDPVEIAWVISVSKLISRTLSYKKNFVNIIMLLDSISKIVLDITSHFRV